MNVKHILSELEELRNSFDGKMKSFVDGLDNETIQLLDRHWRDGRSVQGKELKKKIFASLVSLRLQRFVLQRPHFIEVFVTDQIGTNIAMTNETSDFYQADEVWWQDAKSKGRCLSGSIEYDESVRRWSMAFACPLEDSQDKFNGVLKAVVDLEFFY